MKTSYIVSYLVEGKPVDEQYDTLDSAQDAYDKLMSEHDFVELFIQYNSNGQTWEELISVEDNRKKA